MDKFENKSLKPICSKCNSNKEVIPILYGMPTGEAFKESEEGKLLIGGCVISDNDPQYYCKRCKNRF
jgi:hypothetical protein